MRFSSAFLIVLLSACGCRQNYIDPKLQSYVDGFLNLSEAEKVSQSIGGLGLVVEFGSAPDVSGNPLAIGVCVRDSSGRTVTIDSTAWPRLTPNQQRATVYHELGHCVLGRVHRADMIENSTCPQSIMNPVIDADYCLRMYGVDYNYELFHEGAIITGPVQDSSMYYIPRMMTVPFRID